jgi:hypothetical protein
MIKRAVNRKCQDCGRYLSKKQRIDARFCGAECQKRGHRRKQISKRQDPPWQEFVDLERLLCAAPQQAIAYALLLDVDGEAESLRFPPLDRRSKRFDGGMSRAPHYALRPAFEPPRVPRPGLYRVLLFDTTGCALELPEPLRSGIKITACFSQMRVPKRLPKSKVRSTGSATPLNSL